MRLKASISSWLLLVLCFIDIFPSSESIYRTVPLPTKQIMRSQLPIHEKYLSSNPRCDLYAKALGEENEGSLIQRFTSDSFKAFNNFVVGFVFRILMRFFNNFRVRNKQELLRWVLQRPKGIGLVTVSNHQSLFDDPGIWAAVLPWWTVLPRQMRWILCTEDVFFAVCINLQFLL
jgi:hypothetical protein